MASDTAAATAITKVGYGDIHEQLDNRVVALKKVQRGSKDITAGNLEVQFAAHMGRNQGIGARREGERLPAPLQNKDARATTTLRYQYGRIQGTGQVFKQVSTNTQGFVNWMKREVDGIVDTLARDLNRQVYGDGTGTLAVATASSSGTTLTVDDSHFVELDSYIDVLTAATLGNATPTKANTVPLLVTGVDPVANTVTVATAVAGVTVGSVLVRTDSSTAANAVNNWKREWEGLGLFVGTGTLHGINPAVFPRWVPGYTESAVGSLAELDITHLAQGIDAAGGKITDLLTSYGVINAYWNVLQGKRQYTGSQTTNMSGGVTTPTFQSVFGDIPITADWACPKGLMYAINTNEMYLHQLGDWSWMDKDGSMWNRVPDTDAYEATIFQYSNLSITRRNTFGKLTGITEL